MSGVKQDIRQVSAEKTKGRDVYFMLHIPKCAGRTTQTFIASNFGDKDINPDITALSERYLGENIYWPDRGKAPYRYFGMKYVGVDKITPESIDFAIGFFISKSLKRQFANRNIKESVLVRDPVGHFFSHYNFRMQKYTNAGMNAFGFDIWYKSRSPDPISKFIFAYLEVPFYKQLVLSDQAKLDLILDALTGFWHVGLHKDCGKLIARIAKDKGVSSDFETQNVTYKKFLDYEDYRKKYSEKIADQNRIDQAIFEYFSSKVPIEKRPRPKIRGREFRNALKWGLSPLYLLRSRIKRNFNI